MSAKHTPGPWSITFEDGRVLALSNEHEHIATMRPTCATDRWEADARLIAAAPELLDALKVAREVLFRAADMGAVPGSYDSYVRADIAIAKAEGR